MIHYFKPRSSQSQSGFTLIEVLVVIIIIGVLSAIAAPGWLAFINNRRISTMRGQVADSIRKAQTDAKTTRTMRAVLFDISVAGRKSPRMAVVRCSNTGNQIASSDECVTGTINESDWQSLGNGEVKSGVVQYTATTIAQTGGGADAGQARLVFDANGLVKTSLSGGIPFRISFGLTKPGSSTVLSGEPRCVVVETLLGGIREGNKVKIEGTVLDDCGPL